MMDAAGLLMKTMTHDCNTLPSFNISGVQLVDSHTHTSLLVIPDVYEKKNAT